LIKVFSTATWPILRGSLSTALHADEFVVAPEGAIEEQNAAGIELFEYAPSSI